MPAMVLILLLSFTFTPIAEAKREVHADAITFSLNESDGWVDANGERVEGFRLAASYQPSDSRFGDWILWSTAIGTGTFYVAIAYVWFESDRAFLWFYDYAVGNEYVPQGYVTVEDLWLKPLFPHHRERSTLTLELPTTSVGHLQWRGTVYTAYELFRYPDMNEVNYLLHHDGDYLYVANYDGSWHGVDLNTGDYIRGDFVWVQPERSPATPPPTGGLSEAYLNGVATAEEAIRRGNVTLAYQLLRAGGVIETELPPLPRHFYGLLVSVYGQYLVNMQSLAGRVQLLHAFGFTEVSPA